MLKRAWLIISLAWTAFCLYGLADSGELRHMTIENYALLFAPFLLRLVALFIVYGFPRSRRAVPYRRP